VAISGSNGIGKTNLLDAIHYLSFTKSYFNKPDAISSNSNLSGFRINGSFIQNEINKEVTVIFRENGKKEILMDQSPLNKFSDLIGELPVVFIAPDDTKLITGSSEERRNYLDTLLSQFDHDYLINLIKYNKTLLERNKYLKQLHHIPLDDDLIASFNLQLMQYGNVVLEKRLSFTKALFPKILTIFSFLSDDKETPQISYQASTLPETYAVDLKNSLQKDIVLQRTTIGIHKDDIEIEMNALPFKQTASQGQKKSMLFAFKLASFEILKEKKGYEPILMLDDIFEKLDQDRLRKLMEWVCIFHKGQVFMTDTHQDRLQELMNDISLPFQSIKL